MHCVPVRDYFRGWFFPYGRRVPFSSNSDEVRDDDEYYADGDEQNCVGNKIREDHQGQTTEHGDHRHLFLTVHEESKSDCAKYHTPH